MKVVLLTNAAMQDKLGGLERYVSELARQLALRGNQVVLVCKATQPGQAHIETTPEGVELRRHPVPPKDRPTFAVEYPVAIMRGVARELSAVGPDPIVHGHYALTTLPVTVLRRAYVYTFHAPVYKEALSERQESYFLPQAGERVLVAGLKSMERRVVKRASSLIALSGFMRTELAELDGLAADRAEVLPGGVDTDWFRPGSPEPAPGAEEAAPLLFAARRLTTRTGVLELVACLPRLITRWPALRLVVAGDGHQRAEIERRVAMLQLDDHVQLLGRVSDEELRTWYQRADLCVTPTQALEGFGLATAEALACGTPVMVTPIGANAEVARAVDERFVARDASSASMAEAIARLLGEKTSGAALGARARQVVEERWSWGRVTDDHLEIYERHLAARHDAVGSSARKAGA